MNESKAGDTKPSKNFEQAISEIEKIVAEIEDGQLPLDKIVPRFKRATKLISQCREILADVEQQIQIIESEAGLSDEGEPAKVEKQRDKGRDDEADPW